MYNAPHAPIPPARDPVDPRYSPDLARLGSDTDYTHLKRGERLGLLLGTLAALLFIAGFTWLQQRDERDRLAHQQLETALDRATCDPPDAPLEILIGKFASRADGNPWIVECSYATTSLGQRPQIRFAKPRIAAAQ